MPISDDGLGTPILPTTPTAPAQARGTPPRPMPAVPPALLAPPVEPPAVRQALYVRERDPSTPRSRAGRPGEGIVPVAAGLAPRRAPEAVAPSAAGEGQALGVEMVGPDRLATGEPLAGAILVRNRGAAVLTHVRVELPLPPGARALFSEPAAEVEGGRLTWNLGNLEAGGQRRLEVELRPGGPGEINLRPLASFAATVGLRTSVVRPPFDLTVNVAEDGVSPGATVAFLIRVANHRDTPIRRVVIQDQLPPGLRHPQGDFVQAELGDLAPGELRTIRLEAQAVAVGRLINEVSAQAEGGLEAHTRAAVQVVEPSLTLSVGGPRQGVVSREMTFRVVLASPARASRGAVRVTQVLPEGIDFVAASTGGAFNPSTGAITWTLGALDGPQTLIFKARPRLAGDWALPAAARAEGLAEVRSTRAVHVEGPPALTLDVTPQEDAVDLGGEMTYELRVLNQGPNPCPTLTVLARLPEGLVPVAVEGPARGRIQGRQVTFEPLPGLAPRVDAVYRVRVRGARPGQGRLRVEAHTGSLAGPVVQEVTARVRAGDWQRTPGGP
jgi:uncharacterized repeat protein (TIGR01451 family)